MLSDQFDITDLVSRIDDDDMENRARFLGLMSMLALPEVRTREGRMRRRVVEIRVGDDRWAQIDRTIVESNRIVFSHGSNGHRTEHVFPVSACPEWRVDHGSRRRRAPFAEDR